MEISYWTAAGFAAFMRYWTRSEEAIERDTAEQPTPLHCDYDPMVMPRVGDECEFSPFALMGQRYRIVHVLHRPTAAEVHVVIEPVVIAKKGKVRNG